MKHWIDNKSLPTKEKAFEYYEAIDPDSINDAFEVVENWADGFYLSLK